MSDPTDKPTVFNVLRGEALGVNSTPYGSVGQLFAGDGLEAVWISKEEEQIEPGWFSQDGVDLILVVQGELRFEFERAELPPRLLGQGDFFILPPNTRCRAYRWPRDRREASVFVAIYPSGARSPPRGPGAHGRDDTHGPA